MKSFLTLTGISMACALSGILTSSACAAPKNVLFIICDDLNTHVGPSGYKPIHTPTLDRLAAESMTFKRAYVQYPVCGPSRASMLSGLYPETTRVLDNKVDIKQTRPGTVMLPVAFRRAGYWTGAVGKVFHHAGDNPEGAWDIAEKFENDELPLVTQARMKFEAEHGPVTDRKNKKAWHELHETLGTQTRGQTQPGYGPTGLTDEQHKDGKNARRVVSWLENKTFGDKPFFIACGIQKPHVPFLAPDAYYDRYPLDALRYTPDPADDWRDIPSLAKVKRYEQFGFELGVENDTLRRAYMQAYHACVSFIDAQIGLVLNALKSTGQWDNTIVVFVSDHGYHLGEHFMWGKVTLFEESARIPMMVRVPGITQAGSSSRGLVELIDLYPTLGELCHIAIPENLQGRSIVPLLKDPTAPGKATAYTVVSRGEKLGASIRFDHFRYAEWGSPDQSELYDLESDPRELTNLVTSAPHRETLDQARQLLAQTRKRVQDAR